jgi:hypothetical protein
LTTHRSIPEASATLATEPVLSVLPTAVRQVLRRCHWYIHHVDPFDFRVVGMQLLHKKMYDDLAHGGYDISPMSHISDAVNHTLLHLQTCHPNADHLIKLYKIP